MTSLPYCCPGEVHAISRAVHLARRTSGYSACATCVHAEDAGALPVPPLTVRNSIGERSVFQTDRIWCSERFPTDRHAALRAIEALAEMLWKSSPWRLPVTEWDARDHAPPVAPAVCVGHDGAASSLRFASDVLKVLMRSGCRVISAGAVGTPCLQFAVGHLGTSVGIAIESGGSPAGTAISFYGDDRHPWSLSGRLKDLAGRSSHDGGRPSRTGGSLRTFDVVTPYRAGLPRFFQETRPLEIGVLGMPAFVAESWKAIADRVPCRLHPVAGSVQVHDSEPTAASIRPLVDAILKQRWSGGVIFGDDGRQLWAVDRRNGLIPSRELCRMAASEILAERRERPARVIAYEPTMWMDLNLSGTAFSCCLPTFESISREIERTNAILGADGAGRLWFGAPTLTCDSLMTLAYLVRHWSRVLPAEELAA